MIGNNILIVVRNPIFIHQITNITTYTFNHLLLCSPCEMRMLLLINQQSTGRFFIKPATGYTFFPSCVLPEPCIDLVDYIFSYNFMKKITVMYIFSLFQFLRFTCMLLRSKWHLHNLDLELSCTICHESMLHF